MKKLWKTIDGHKTGIGLVAGGIVFMLYKSNIITPDTFDYVITLIGMWTGVALSLKANKVIKK